MNVGEYGQVFRFNAFQDISSGTPTLKLRPKYGTTITVTTADGVTIPDSAINVNGQTFNANEYIEYTVKEGDLTYAGRWEAKLEVLYSPTDRSVTDWKRFTVLP